MSFTKVTISERIANQELYGYFIGKTAKWLYRRDRLCYTTATFSAQPRQSQRGVEHWMLVDNIIPAEKPRLSIKTA
jgi:hypothetical protein